MMLDINSSITSADNTEKNPSFIFKFPKQNSSVL